MTTLPLPQQGRGQEWLAVLGGLAALYVPSFVGLASTLWKSDEQLHGPIVLAVTLYLFWDMRHAVHAARYEPRSALGWSLLFVGLLCFVVGRSQDIILFELGSLLCVLPAILLLMRGTAALRVCWFPVFFLFFMIPLPSPVVDALTLPMKTAVSWGTEQLLYAAGYPVSRAGVIIHLGQYRLLVANACAGLHTLFTLEAMGLLYLHLTKHESWARNTTLALFIIPISFTSNVIRVLTLCLVTFYWGDEAGQGFLHGFAGMVLFVSALLLIIGVDSAIQFYFNKRQIRKQDSGGSA